MHSNARQRFEELVAGLVLGNLDAEELQELQQALITQRIASEDLMASIQVVTQLQADSDRQEVAPPARLRLEILEAATREGRALRDGDRPKQVWRPAFWQLALGGCVAAGIIGLALDNTSLRQQLAQADRQQAFWERAATQTNGREIAETPASSSLPLALVATTEQVFDDHLKALERDLGPADFPSDRLEALWEHFRSVGALSSPPPSLAGKEAELLGGSPCWFKAARGVRFNYVLQEEKTVSFYQLSPLAAAELAGKTGPVYVNSADGTNMVFWGEGKILYAIVGNLPFPTLKQLASTSI